MSWSVGSDWVQSFSEATSEAIPREAIRPERPNQAPCTADDIGLPRRMGGSNPRISVIIPTYDDAEYLTDSLASVGALTSNDVEVVLIDSSGEDWVRNLAHERRWIRHVASVPQGVSAARNDGIEHARGEFLAFLDADDYWHPLKLERQIEAMGDEFAVAYSGYYFLNFWAPDGPTLTVKDVENRVEQEASIELLKRHIDAHISTLVCRADIVPPRPFDEDLRNFEDVIFTVECFRRQDPVHIPEPLAVRRLRSDSVSDRTDELTKCRHRITGYERVARRYPEYADISRKLIAREHFRAGLVNLRRGNRSGTRTRFRRSMGMHTGGLNAAVLYLLTFLPISPINVVDKLDRFPWRDRNGLAVIDP